MTRGELIALDTSVAVPLLSGTHPDHLALVNWARGRRFALTGHSLAETYSVLTRLRGDMRAGAADAALRVRQRFAAPVTMGPETSSNVPALLADAGIIGGAIYDGLVALAALEHNVALATRDRRALPVYRALGVRIEVVG